MRKGKSRVRETKQYFLMLYDTVMSLNCRNQSYKHVDTHSFSVTSVECWQSTNDFIVSVEYGARVLV